MKSNNEAIHTTRQWLTDHAKSQAWLADQMGVAKSLISQIFSGHRKLQAEHLIKIAEITGLSIAELTASETQEEAQPICSLRGKISNQAGERGLAQLLLDAEHFVQLLGE